MANNVLSYLPVWYANQALDFLAPRLGFARLVNRQYDQELRPNSGNVVEIPVRSAVEASDFTKGGKTDYQNLSTSKKEIRIDRHADASFLIDDSDAAMGRASLINDHVGPAAVAIAEKVERELFGLYADVPWTVQHDPAKVINDFTNADLRLNENNAPVDGRYMAISPGLKAAYIGADIFANANTDVFDGLVQRSAILGDRYGFGTFMSQLVSREGINTMGNDRAGAADGAASAGDTTIAVDGLGTGTVSRGQTFTVVGSERSYVVTADTTLASNQATLPIAPALDADIADNAVVTFQEHGPRHSLAFHRDAFALVTVPLPEMNASQATVTNPDSGLSIRATVNHDQDMKATKFSFDLLYGLDAVQPDLAVRVESAS